MMTKTFILGVLMMAVMVTYGQENNQAKVGSLQGSTSSPTASRQEAPTNTVAQGIANVNQETLSEDVRYTFISNRVFDETTKERWEYRFPISFPYLKGFSMNVDTQTVELILPASHTDEELKKLITKFGYEDYSIN